MPGPLLQLRRAAERFTSTADGVDSRHLFSFGEHYDPDWVGHGPLLVLNEERLAAGHGFDDHPHADAEICTWVLSGALVHGDSRGGDGVLRPGTVQRLSAGRGVRHRERADAGAPAHFVQAWLMPDTPGAEPSLARAEVDRSALADGWLPVLGDHPDAPVGTGTAGATLWATVLRPGVGRPLPEGPRALVFVARGAAELAGLGPLATGDAVRAQDAGGVALHGGGDGADEAEVLVWTLP